jgi:hypothetical protein
MHCMSQIEHELQMELHWKRNEVRHGAGNPAHLEIEGTVESMRTNYRRMEEDQRRLGLRKKARLVGWSSSRHVLAWARSPT